MTTVELFEDIGLDMTMKRTMEFSTKKRQDTWFSERVSNTITDVAFNKLQNILKLPMDYGEALKYTYIRFKDLDASGRMYYYFVASIELVDDSTVALHLAIDPIQTFMTEWSVGPCMVNRKHCDRWGSGALPLRENSNIEGIQASYLSVNTQVINHTKTIVGTTLRVGTVIVAYTGTSMLRIGAVPIIFDSLLLDYIQIGTKKYQPPSLRECYDNQIFTMFDIDPEKVVSMCFVPFLVLDGTLTYDGGYVWSFPETTSFITTDDDKAMIDLYSTSVIDFGINISRPTKPTGSDYYSTTHEPALYKEPYIIRKISSVDGIFNQDIPDILINDEESTLYMKAQIAPSQQSIICSMNDDLTDAGNIVARKDEGLMTSVMPSALDVTSNAWLTYSLTQRDSDRAIINNNNMQNAISNLLFMGYGGALVGSRGGGIIKDNAIYDNAAGVPKSQQAILGYRKGINPAIPGAVGLAAGASIVTSLVDAHFAWENQKQQERKIQNKASQITISGNSAYANALLNYTAPVFSELKCDDVNFEKAANNFRYYGYEINEWQKPDIKSRKYFDYILTNGAIIEGAIPQDIKEQIAKVLDNGITFFHSDYTTSTQYNNYENIERALI